jgi:hypothetical protein
LDRERPNGPNGFPNERPFSRNQRQTIPNARSLLDKALRNRLRHTRHSRMNPLPSEPTRPMEKGNTKEMDGRGGYSFLGRGP